MEKQAACEKSYGNIGWFLLLPLLLFSLMLFFYSYYFDVFVGTAVESIGTAVLNILEINSKKIGVYPEFLRDTSWVHFW